jgi:hypothetical protein
LQKELTRNPNILKGILLPKKRIPHIKPFNFSVFTAKLWSRNLYHHDVDFANCPTSKKNIIFHFLIIKDKDRESFMKDKTKGHNENAQRAL